jgi:hypothetical protein
LRSARRSGRAAASLIGEQLDGGPGNAVARQCGGPAMRWPGNAVSSAQVTALKMRVRKHHLVVAADAADGHALVSAQGTTSDIAATTVSSNRRSRFGHNQSTRVAHR